MRKDITIAAEARDTRGKNEARRLRAAGKIPAVLYGTGGASVAVSVNPKEIARILHSSTGHNTIFDVAVAGGETAPVMVVDWLNHPVRGSLMHIDLKRIDLSKKLRVKVPVHTAGEPVGVKIQGGLFELINREIEIECLPNDIPEHFTADVSGLNIGDAVRAGDVALTDAMRLVGHPELVIAHVVTTRGSDETAAATDEAGAEAKAEPEVVKKGKKEEEAPAAAEKGKKK
jgi:large subunit ribosomal protein L25